MGEIADAMLNGLLCVHCGAVTGEGEVGYPVSCCEYKPDKHKRFEIALQKLKDAGFEPRVCSEKNHHIKVGEWNFWAWTGKIYHPSKKLDDNTRGITKFIQLIS